MASRTLAHYQILEEISRGAMGIVYRALDLTLNREVALKVLPEQLSEHQDRLARFEREARLLASLNHPNIATIHGLELADGVRFLVLELVEGETLKEQIARGPLPLERALHIFGQIAEALQVAHEKGVIHRDLKPDNIKITPEGKVKVLDFGLAKAFATEPDESGKRKPELSQSPTLTKEGTAAGTILGTASYMSPEQARAKEVEKRTDIWSFGCCLYESLTGRKAFGGETTTDILAAIIHKEPDWNALPPETPSSIRTLLQRCLQKDAAGRLADISEATAETNRLLSNPDALRPTPLLAAIVKHRRLSVGLSALALIALGTLLMIRSFRPTETPASVSPNAVAIMPFAVGGSQGIAYLGDGMVNLLGTKLDGAGELRSVDSRALLSHVKRQGDAILGPNEGAAVAEHFGAGLYVMGDIVEAGGRLQINAALYDRGQGQEPVAEGTTEGDITEVFDLVDDIATQLLVSMTDGTGDGVRPITAVTTSSLPALRAYLEGESALRVGDFASAVEAYQHAVAEDDQFALAHYRLSIAAEWLLKPELAYQAAQDAGRLASRLSEHDRRLLEASLAYRRGSFEEAEEHYRSLVGTYPDDVEAWFQLGEVHYHTNPLRGRPVTDSRTAFERVISYEPDHAGALVHLARLAAHESKPDELDTLARKMFELTPEGDRILPLRALQAFSHGKTEEQEQVVAELARAGDAAVALSAWDVVLHTGSLDRAEHVVQVLAAPSRAFEAQTLGHAWLAHLKVARGHWEEAKRELEALESINLGAALEYRALLSSLPFLPVPKTELDALREAARRWDFTTIPKSGNPSVFFNAHDELHPLLRAYLLGLLSAQLGDAPAALEQASKLEHFAVPAGAGTLPTDLALSIKAQVDRERGAPQEALETLDGVRMESFYPLMVASPFYARALERFSRAELLVELGRDQEALPWYQNFAGTTPFESAYLPLAHLRQGQIYERLGEIEASAQHYTRFLELWKDCDPNLRPWVEEAEQKLADLRDNRR